MLDKLKKIEPIASMLLRYRDLDKNYNHGWAGYRIIFDDLVTERVKTKYGGLVIQLDRSFQSTLNFNHRHYHYAPLGLKVIDGVFLMERGEGDLSLKFSEKKVFIPNETYEMIKFDEWHNIAPITTIHTFGITGKEFYEAYDNPSNLKFERLGYREINPIKDFFKPRLKSQL
jgi:hypothetical protein